MCCQCTCVQTPPATNSKFAPCLTSLFCQLCSTPLIVFPHLSGMKKRAPACLGFLHRGWHANHGGYIIYKLQGSLWTNQDSMECHTFFLFGGSLVIGAIQFCVYFICNRCWIDEWEDYITLLNHSSSHQNDFCFAEILHHPSRFISLFGSNH